MTGLTQSQTALSHLVAAIDELIEAVALFDPAGKGVIGPIVDLLTNYADQLGADIEEAQS